MKHLSKVLVVQFEEICAKGTAVQKFYLLDDPRYFALFRVVKVSGTPIYKGASQSIKTVDQYVLYIYDSENYNGSVAFKVFKDGTLGFHGQPPDVIKQQTLVEQIVNQVYLQVMGS